MFYSLFSKHVAAHPRKIAVEYEGRGLTYGDMDKKIRQVARNLLTIGVEPGELVCVCLDDGVQYLILYYALTLIGSRIMPLTTSTGPEEIEMFCRECGPDYYIVSSPYHEKYATLLKRLGGNSRLISRHTPRYDLSSIFEAKADATVALPSTPWTDRDLVVHYSTPNTPEATERFKGAVQTHKSHAFRMLNWAEVANITADDRTLCMHPLMHAFGSDMFALPALSTGQTLYLMAEDEATPENVAQAIQANRITLFGALPFFYTELIDLPSSSRADLSSLRVAICAETPPVEVAERFYKLYGKRLSNSYGMAETSLIASNLDENDMHDLHTVGRVVVNVDSEIRDCGVDIPGAGELLVRSRGFAVRYFSPEGPTLWRGDWIHTGDVVRKSEDGKLYILGRVSQIVHTAEGKYLPLEVEQTIGQHPKVKEVAVVPVDGGGVIKTAAFIVREGQLSEDDIRIYVEQRLSRYKVPTYIQFQTALPKSPTGRVSRNELRVNGLD